jgi:hypothetical protein
MASTAEWDFISAPFLPPLTFFPEFQNKETVSHKLRQTFLRLLGDAKKKGNRTIGGT